MGKKTETFTRGELVKEFYEFVRMVYSKHPDIIKEFNQTMGRPIKIPMLEYYKEDKDMLKALIGGSS